MSSDLFGWQSVYMSMLEDCELRASKLSEWELAFVRSLRAKFDRAGFVLSPLQVDKLESIWERVTK